MGGWDKKIPWSWRSTSSTQWVWGHLELHSEWLGLSCEVLHHFKNNYVSNIFINVKGKSISTERRFKKQVAVSSLQHWSLLLLFFGGSLQFSFLFTRLLSFLIPSHTFLSQSGCKHPLLKYKQTHSSTNWLVHSTKHIHIFLYPLILLISCWDRRRIKFESVREMDFHSLSGEILT